MTEKKIYGFFDDSLDEYPFFRKALKDAFPSIIFIFENIGPRSVRTMLRDGHTIIRMSRNREDTTYRVSWCVWGEHHSISNPSRTNIINFISKRLAGE